MSESKEPPVPKVIKKSKFTSRTDKALKATFERRRAARGKTIH